MKIESPTFHSHINSTSSFHQIITENSVRLLLLSIPATFFWAKSCQLLGILLPARFQTKSITSKYPSVFILIYICDMHGECVKQKRQRWLKKKEESTCYTFAVQKNAHHNPTSQRNTRHTARHTAHTHTHPAQRQQERGATATTAVEAETILATNSFVRDERNQTRGATNQTNSEKTTPPEKTGAKNNSCRPSGRTTTKYCSAHGRWQNKSVGWKTKYFEHSTQRFFISARKKTFNKNGNKLSGHVQDNQSASPSNRNKCFTYTTTPNPPPKKKTGLLVWGLLQHVVNEIKIYIATDHTQNYVSIDRKKKKGTQLAQLVLKSI